MGAPLLDKLRTEPKFSVGGAMTHNSLWQNLDPEKRAFVHQKVAELQPLLIPGTEVQLVVQEDNLKVKLAAPGVDLEVSSDQKDFFLAAQDVSDKVKKILIEIQGQARSLIELAGIEASQKTLH